jgi:integrase
MAKRGNNEGSISKRPDGRWEGRVTLEQGRRKSFYGTTRSDVAKVDLDHGIISVRQALQRLDGKYQFVELKTARSRRSLALPTLIIEKLRAHRIRQIEECLLAGDHWEEWGLVFSSLRGTPQDAKNVTHRFQALLAREGLPRRRFHDLRHSCATLLLAQGVHPRVVMETLGHSQIAMTMNTYSPVMPALQRDAANQMDAMLTGAS